MSGSKAFVILFLLFANAFSSFGQQKSKAQLQNERALNIKKIQEAEQTLQETSTKKNSSVGQLNALKFQITTRQKVIRSIEQEVGLLDDEIKDNLDIIASLENDLSSLKNEYSAMVYAAYKASNGRSKLTFLFSAESFNQLFRRLEYMEQYGEARKKQVEQIVAVQEILREENESVKAKRLEQTALLTEQKSENASLVSLRKQEQSILSSLQKEEKQLKKELAQRLASLKALDKLISDLIRREAEAAARAAALKKDNSSAVLSADFSKNKLKLPWPTSGFVSQKFGKTPDPVLKNVERNSPGIEIQTKPNSQAKNIFKGKVTQIALIPGFNKAVVVKHGDYYSVYAKLDEVFVKKGQDVEFGEKLGTIFTRTNGISELHFEIWQFKENGAVKLNPESWLLKK